MRLAESLVLDLDHDGRVTVAEYRQALKLPDAKQVQASLLSAGPGRQDLTNEFGLDMTAPGLHSRRYADVGLMRTGPEGVFNPKSTPSSLVVRSLSVINWAATYATRGVDWLGRYAERTGQRRGQALAELGIEFPPGLEGDADLINRAMVLDGRTIGAIGLQADSFPGIMYARVLRQGAPAPPALVRGLRLGFEATQIRKLLYDTDLASIARPALDAGAVARGRAIFFDRTVVGDIINQQILVDVPPVYAEANIQPPLLAPIDETRPLAARIPVRCVSCHSATTLATDKPIPKDGTGNPPLHRLPSRARAHGPAGHGWPAQGQAARLGWRRSSTSSASTRPARAPTRSKPPAPAATTATPRWPRPSPTPIAAFCPSMPTVTAARKATSARIWPRVASAPMPYSASRSIAAPSRQGRAHAHHAHSLDPSPGPAETVQIAGPWVRTAPLTTLVASAPYLHNGSVPTLEALLEDTDARPATFTLGSGQGTFTFDTRLPGNRNTGHEFGTKLGAQEKRISSRSSRACEPWRKLGTAGLRARRSRPGKRPVAPGAGIPSNRPGQVAPHVQRRCRKRPS
jgi:hypothetical protein